MVETHGLAQLSGAVHVSYGRVVFDIVGLVRQDGENERGMYLYVSMFSSNVRVIHSDIAQVRFAAI